MVDEVVAPVEPAPIAPAIAEPVAPVTPAPAEALVVAEPAAVVTEPVKEEPKTVLGAEPAKPAEKAAESNAEIKPVTDDKKPASGDQKPVEEKKVEGDKSDEPAPLPTYEEFKLPEGMTVTDNEQLNDFTKTLGEYEIAISTDPAQAHAKTQELGQKLVDRHVAGITAAVTRMNELNLQNWEKQKNDWKESFVKDPEIGGNRQDTTVSAAREFITTHGGTPEQQAEFRTLMETTGVGNHPAMIRMLASAMKAKAEGGPLPATKPMPESTSKVQKRYGGSV